MIHTSEYRLQSSSMDNANLTSAADFSVVETYTYNFTVSQPSSPDIRHLRRVAFSIIQSPGLALQRRYDARQST